MHPAKRKQYSQTAFLVSFVMVAGLQHGYIFVGRIMVSNKITNIGLAKILFAILHHRAF
jgi:hypothetical protein